MAMLICLHGDWTVNTHPPTSSVVETTPETETAHHSRIITKVLSPALRLWLRSQVSQVSYLEVKIIGGDRQILSGYIPQVEISAQQTVYQGLHISHLHLVATNIRINIGAVLRGQPLRLLAPVPVRGELLLQENDLNASLPSSLLSTAIAELLSTLLPEACPPAEQMHWQKITIDNSKLLLDATLTSQTNSTPVKISTKIKLASHRELQLDDTEIRTLAGSLLGESNSYNLDLGPEVDLEELSLMAGNLTCRGQVNVIP